MKQLVDIKKSFLVPLLVLLTVAGALGAGKLRKKTVIPPSTPLNEITFVAFDTETTGLSAAKERIVEIGAVKYLNGKIIDQKEWLINPGRPIPFHATKVHGITDKMVEGKPAFKEIYPEFLKFSQGCVLIAHNSRFDRDFMHAEMKRAKIESTQLPLLDSLKLFRALIPDAPSHSLGHLVEYLGIVSDNFHRALIDSVYIVRILKKLTDEKYPDLHYKDLIEHNKGYDYL